MSTGIELTDAPVYRPSIVQLSRTVGTKSLPLDPVNKFRKYFVIDRSIAHLRLGQGVQGLQGAKHER